MPILRTNEFTSTIMSAIVAFLKVNLAPRVTLHGVLIEIYGEGVLLLGESGVGKSETAIELCFAYIDRGRREARPSVYPTRRSRRRPEVPPLYRAARHRLDARRIFGRRNQDDREGLRCHQPRAEDGKQNSIDIAVPSSISRFRA